MIKKMTTKFAAAVKWFVSPPYDEWDVVTLLLVLNFIVGPIVWSAEEPFFGESWVARLWLALFASPVVFYILYTTIEWKKLTNRLGTKLRHLINRQ